ncbi:MAG: DNA polymerase I [Dehalococcoidia bacterium]|nr:DNA polymerase I [Dehalococcoidia bacterium]
MSPIQGKPLLLLFDGNALVHRAHHALPPLTISRTGEVISAVFGFASMLLKAINELKPTHMAVAFDRPEPTFRHQEFEAYKSHRPKTAPELVPQFARVRQLLDAFRIPTFDSSGLEADDVLGTLSLQAQGMGVETVIVTGDTDAMQLVAPGVRLLTPRRGFADTVVYDESQVRERYSLEPYQIADLKALVGDSSDNIPGVAGIGEKTAVRLLQQFGSVEGIYERLQEVSPAKLRELLERNEDLSRLCKRLATIIRDAPVILDLEACRFGRYDRDQVVQIFREWEFRSLLAKLPQPSGPVQGSQQLTFFEQQSESGAIALGEAPPDYRTVAGAAELAELLRQVGSGPLVVEVETTSKDAMRADLVGISISPRPSAAWYLPVGHIGVTAEAQLPLGRVVEAIRPLLEDPSLPKVFHDAKYVLTVLARYGLRTRNVAFDTMLAAYLLNEKALGLKDLAFGNLGMELAPIASLIGTGRNLISLAQAPILSVAEYACADADAMGRLKPVLETGLQEKGLWDLFTTMEMPLAPILMEMEMHGVALDVDLLGRMSVSLGEQLREKEAAIYREVGHQFNINSPLQLSSILFEELRLPGQKRTKTGYSTDAVVLEGLKGAHPVIGLLLDYRQLSKLKSTYVDALPALVHPRTGRVHTSFNQAATATGRLSSSDPNLQNIPIRTELGREVRRAFTAPNSDGDYVLLSADYSQIEVRILAHVSQDPNLLEAFASGEDVHSSTASLVFGIGTEKVTSDMRRVAKTINFGVIYGISEFGLAQRTDLSRKDAADFISAYFRRYGRVREYMERTKRQAYELGYVQTLLGRRRYIPEIHSPNAQVRSGAERMAINMPIQGTAADITKLAMILVQEELERGKRRTRMVLQVHDELVFEVPLDEVDEVSAMIREKMESAFSLSVPLKVDVRVGKNWGDLS